MKNLSKINKFFDINNDKDFWNNMFKVLKEVIEYDSAIISFTNSKETYSVGKKNSKYTKLTEDLKFKTTIFGKIEIYKTSFSQNEKQIFKFVSSIIANIIKDKEMSEIMKMHINALQDGVLQLKESESAKNKFVSHISHELRTPINSILGFSDLLEKEFVGKLNEKQKEYINDIKISSLNLLEMVNEILDMSKIEANAMKITPRAFYIKDLVFEIENIVQPLLQKKNLKLIKNITNIEIFADQQKFQQILLNILSNAIKYAKSKIELTAKVKNNNIKISIIDDGIGIPEEFKDKIFERFEQIDNNISNSTGLGLAIAKELTALHNGSIKLEKAKGAKFVVTIPLKYSSNML